MTDARPVLFFDSGVGGLSVLDAAQALLPTMPVVYVADNAGYPYGTKSEAEIAARVPALLGRLAERYRPRLIVIACNTASTIALAHVRSALDLPIVGTVPAIKPAALASKTRVIGVLGTDATVRQPYVDRLAAELATDCIVLRHGSAELVDAAEAVLRGETPDPAIFARAIRGLTDQPGGNPLDTVVLACTHFPLVETQLAAAAKNPFVSSEVETRLSARPRPSTSLGTNGAGGLTFVHGAQGIARRIATLTDGQDWPGVPPPGIAVFTRDDPAIAPLAPALAMRDLTRIEKL